MIRSRTLRNLALAGLGCGLLACAGMSKPITMFGFSAWVSESGASMSNFETSRQNCLRESGIDDPATVVRNSSAERAFATCMQVAGWCTQTGSCE